MPARDIYHFAVKNALLADGWTITHDPLALKIGTRDLYIDLGAERVLAAEKSAVKIAVEVKSFLGPSLINELERALGQFILYADVLSEREPERTLYLAVPRSFVDLVLEEPVGELLLRKGRLRVVLFDLQREEIVQWIPQNPIEPLLNE